MRNKKGQFIKGHPMIKGVEKGWFIKGVPMPCTEEKRLKIIAALKGKKLTPEHRLALSLAPRKPLSLDHRLKISRALKGKNAPNWQGGITAKNAGEAKVIRNSMEYKLWREAVFRRDNWKCVDCGKGGRGLHVDHIKPFVYFPKLRMDINNGRVLCGNCHKYTATYCGRIRLYKELKDKYDELRSRVFENTRKQLETLKAELLTLK
jgi:hypothetical protein